MGNDDWFGEEDLFLKQKRSYTVCCESQKGEVYQIPVTVFQMRILNDNNGYKNI